MTDTLLRYSAGKTYAVLFVLLSASWMSAQTLPSSSAKASSSVNAGLSTVAALHSRSETSSRENTAKVQEPEDPSEKPRHLLIGHTISLSSSHRFSKIYVTDPKFLLAYMASSSEVLVTAKDPGLGSVVLWEEGGGVHRYLFSADLDTEPLQKAIEESMPRESIHVSCLQDHLMLSGNVSTQQRADDAGRLAMLYSKNVTNALVVNSNNVPQVRLKVRILEVDRTKLEQLGFNIFNVGGNTLLQSTTSQFASSLTASTGGGTSSSGGTTATAGSRTVTYSNALNFLLYSSQLNIGAMVQDLENRQVLQILAEPNITALSGEKANFLAGGEFPFPVVQGSTGGMTSISIQFRPYGVRLEFTPTVNSDGTIQLKVAPEVSALDYTNAVQISGYTIPALSTRRAETEVVLQNHQSFAISGLLDNRMTDQLSRTPGLSSLPILGALFKSKSLNHSRTELLVLVTPETVDPLHETQSAELPKMAVPGLSPEAFDASLPKPAVAKPSAEGAPRP